MYTESGEREFQQCAGLPREQTLKRYQYDEIQEGPPVRNF